MAGEPIPTRVPAIQAVTRLPAIQAVTRLPAIQAVTRTLREAEDPRIMRVVAMVDAMISRGPADQLIAPIRPRLAILRPPRPLRFARLMFHPLDRLIVPPARWRPGRPVLPRTALRTMAEHVRLAMGVVATRIEAEIAGRTTADTVLIARLGRSLWPAAAAILADKAIPDDWDTTALGAAAYRPLADSAAVLLAEAPALDALCSDSVADLLPPTAETIAALLGRVAKSNRAALPMMLTLLLDRLPEAAALLPTARKGSHAAAIQAATDEAADFLLGQLDQPAGGIETRVAAGTLADAAAAAGRIATLLVHLETPTAKPQRRDRLRAMRQRLNAGCKARFVSALQDELLAPLQHGGATSDPVDIAALEAAARGLRVLESEARAVGGGSTYDLLLGKAAEAIKGNAMRDRLAPVEQIRLVEILSGSDAALAMFDPPS
jgi:hypothetical protein